jgi:diguanylate cyclase (GGDEF)-like protein/PAS domain S-box-containing protein
MTVIDIRTFFTCYVLSILLCVIVMTSLWWQNRKRSPEIALWLVDYILQFIALLLITFRGILPNLATIVLADLFIIGGTVVLYIGLGRYVEKESRQLHNYVMLAVFTLAHLYLTYVYPDIELRIVNQSLALIYICAQGSWLMLRRVDPSLRPATRATGIVCAAFCIVSVVQIVVNLTIPKVNNLFVSGFIGVVAVLMYQILFTALTFALFLLVSRRLSTALESELFQRMQTEEELRQSEEKFAKSFQTSPYAIAITRLEDGKFIEVNNAFATVTGYSRAEVMVEASIGLNLWVNEKDREEMASFLRQGLPVIGREFLFRRKNGEVWTGLYSSQVIQLTQEPCLLSSINDITERKEAEQKLKETRDYLDNLITYANAPIITWSSDFTITRFNHAFEYLSGMKAEDVLGKKLEILFPQESKEESISKIRMALAGEFWESVEIPILRKDGTVRTALWNSANIYGADGKTLVATIAQGYDITERKKAEQALLESEERYRFIADHTADHIWTMDLSLRFIYSSPAVIKILGYTVAELMAQTIDQFFSPESLVMAGKLIVEELEIDKDQNADPNRIRMFQSEHYRKNGTLVWLESSLTFIRDASMKPIGILGVSRDITERKKAEEQIQYLATHDLLTDLPGLRLAKDRLSVALNMARRYKKAVAVMFIDLDGFKAVNDTLGHDAGDYVLQQVAQRMLSCVRETDTVARVGGDEFLIIATEINAPENATQIAEKVIHLVSQPVTFKGKQAVVGTSIGIALFPDHGEDMDQLIKQADEAMYRVKNAGKNGFRFVNTAIK